ncbi:MAG: hypothetical protein HLUCCX10_06495 [Algoriphagus marincola HL-49]|uniref:Uncharacterized protein n=1 Tax=Algoriphagus marincola HL-49 TaxID=1305737 RepID=A0A0P7YPG9_9BACT|nr:MAG: hypothetical protein HLUCCX10_06495 [Algoriphagus marincola HL-49]
MEKSVIKICLFFVFLLIFQNESFGQRKAELTEEQYNVLENTYRKAKEKTIDVYYHTIPFESWMQSLWNEDNYSDMGVGFCSFKEPDIKLAFSELKKQVFDLEEKEIYWKKLSDKIKTSKRKKRSKVSFLSEPIIIGDYSFVFSRSVDQKSVHVLKKDTLGKWKYECGVPLEFELH